MSASSDQIRQMIGLLESSVSTDRSLEEGPLINKALSALGSKRAFGRVERDTLAKKWLNGFNVWLGRTNRKGTTADIQSYLGILGFKPNQVSAILDDQEIGVVGADSGGEPASTEPESGDNPAEPERSAAAEPTPGEESPAAAAGEPPTPGTEPSSEATKQQSLSKMNWHDSARQQHIKNATDIQNHLSTNGSTLSPQDRQKAEQKLQWHKNRANVHRDSYNNHEKDYKAHKAASDTPIHASGEKLAASRTYSGNKLMELEVPLSPLSRSEIAKLFTNAAAYAHDNNLLKGQTSNNARSPQQAGSTGGGYGGYDGGSSANQGDRYSGSNRGTQSQQTPAIAQKVMDFAIKEGLTQGTIADLRRAVQGSRNLGRLDQGKQESLKLIGFAFLKNL